MINHHENGLMALVLGPNSMSLLKVKLDSLVARPYAAEPLFWKQSSPTYVGTTVCFGPFPQT